MNPMPFSKPHPAEPLPLERWFLRTDRDVSGRDAFFRGREAEFGVFQSALTGLGEGMVGGGSLIFQGAPGVGKSALMAECIESVRCHSTLTTPWVAVSIPPGCLHSPIDVTEILIDAVKAERERLRCLTLGSGYFRDWEDFQGLVRKLFRKVRNVYRALFFRGVGTIDMLVNKGRDVSVTAGRIFQKAAPLMGDCRIVVCVDEAQNIPITDTTRGVLDCLHWDSRGIPLITAFFGLSDTQAVLRACGLSRFADGWVVTLEPLSDADTACALRDMLKTYGFQGAPQDQDVWVNRLTELSQGWPQHINRVAVAAVRAIQEHNGSLDEAVLESALERGRERIVDYCLGRLASGSGRVEVYKELALAAQNWCGNLPYYKIDTLTEQMRHNTGETLDEFLNNALHAGLLAPARNLPDHYRIPIPSLRDYLLEFPSASK